MEQRLRDAQQESERALAFPRLVSEGTMALEPLERLRTADAADNLAGSAAETREMAHQATTLLTTQPPPDKMPGLYIRMMAFVFRHRPKSAWPE